ncbi:serine/threonine-protein kinase mos [Octopus bimaculoides]|nr:serine/threonine-protein kinase mos [Octopus bimaculoides]|eukprot:XP_014773578.1 PREDICTED: serine/threonine-protein kinase mos-like [Octopus bimaculoides]
MLFNMAHHNDKYQKTFFSDFTKQMTDNLCSKDVITPHSLCRHINCHKIIPFNNNADGQLRKDLHIIKKLGSGGFGTVYLVCWKSKKFALKILHRKPDNLVIKCLKAEQRLLHFEHPNIVRTLMVHSFWTGHENGLILMEYVGERNLRCLIDDSKEVLCYNRRVKYGLQVSKAMEFIHSKHVVHLDLKPTNIIITDNDVCKICDFGCSQCVKWPVVETSSLSGTATYIAPELLKGKQPTKKCDVYSFGIILWQMLSRKVPFEYENPHVIIYKVVTDNLRPKEIDSLKTSKDLAYVTLYKQCWDRKPQDRPTFEGLVETFNTWVNKTFFKL